MASLLWCALKKHLYKDWEFWKSSFIALKFHYLLFLSHSGEQKQYAVEPKMFPEECSSKQPAGK